MVVAPAESSSPLPAISRAQRRLGGRLRFRVARQEPVSSSAPRYLLAIVLQQGGRPRTDSEERSLAISQGECNQVIPLRSSEGAMPASGYQ